MGNVSRGWPFVVRRCTRCIREAAVIVPGEDKQRVAIAACVEHLEWAFFVGVDEWSGRRRAA